MRILHQLLLFSLLISLGCSQKGPVAPAMTEAELPEAMITMAAALYAADAVAEDNKRAALKKFQLGYSPSLEAKYPVRRKLYDLVSAWPEELKRECLDYFAAYPFWNTVYHAYLVESFTAAPEFRPREYKESMWNRRVYGARSTFSELLSKVHGVLSADRQWDELLDMFNASKLDPQKASDTMKKSLAFIRWPDAYKLPEFIPVYNPLMMPGTGCGTFPEPGKSVYLVGPMATEKGIYMVVSHELLHFPILELMNRSSVLQKAYKETEDAFKAVGDLHLGYSAWPSYFNESMVRALSYRVMELPFSNTEFMFEYRYYNALAEFAQSDETLETFLVRMLYDTAAEDPQKVVIELESETVPPGRSVYISGNIPELGGWNAAGLFVPQKDATTWRTTRWFPNGYPLEYKFTLGSWETVERAAGGGQADNHRHTVTGPTTLRHTVKAWSE